jgi:hypothetical protein
MRHSTFIEAVNATSESQTYYKPPSYHGLRTDLLKQSKMDVSKQVTERTQNVSHKCGTTICSNGCNNFSQRPLLNIMFSCPNGDAFMGSIDTIGEWKDAYYICNALGGYIKTIGVDNIVQICTNNASSMKSVIDLLICHFLGLCFQGCVAHYLDLLLEDWGKATWVKWIVKKVKLLFFFIWQHHVPFTIFHHYENKLLLLIPTETQFATNFLMVERFFKFKPTIEQPILDPNWTTFVNSLHGNHCQNSLAKVQIVRANIRRDKCLDICANFVHMVELVLLSLRAFDGKQPCVGSAWFIMKRLEWHVLSSWDPSFELPSNLVDVVEDQFY